MPAESAEGGRSCEVAPKWVLKARIWTNISATGSKFVEDVGFADPELV